MRTFELDLLQNNTCIVYLKKKQLTNKYKDRLIYIFIYIEVKILNILLYK